MYSLVLLKLVFGIILIHIFKKEKIIRIIIYRNDSLIKIIPQIISRKCKTEKWCATGNMGGHAVTDNDEFIK